MRRIMLFVVASLLGILVIVAIPFVAAADDFGSDVMNALNANRAAAGEGSLAWDQALANSAQAYAQTLADSGQFDHYLNGTSPSSRAQDAGYAGASFIGENLAMGYPDGGSTVAGWQNSPEHQANDLNPDYQNVGVGYAQTPGGQIICVADFG